MVLAKVDRERAVALAADSEQAVGEAERDERDEALAVVARALAAVEQWDRAEQAVRTITDADTQAKALGDLAGALADAGLWDRAERVARAIPDLEAQVRTLAALAGALAAIDQDRALAVTDQADGTARAIPNQYDQAKAWTLIVERLTAAGSLDPADGDDPFHLRIRRLLAEVLAGERWLDALEPLGKLDPAALAAVDQELRA
jgi:hypothetical protein